MMPSFPIGLLLLLDIIAISLFTVALARPAKPGEQARLRERRTRVQIALTATIPLFTLAAFVVAKSLHAVTAARIAGATAWLSMAFFFVAGIYGLAGRALIATALAVVGKVSPAASPSVDLRKRRLLLGVPRGAAALGAAVATNGIANGQTAPRLRRIELTYADLPQELDGLTILQLSDLHLGVSLGLEDLDAALKIAKEARPDLVVVTGDVVDDRPLFDHAIPKIAALAPPGGVFACLGNHEYLRRTGLDPAHWRRLGVTLLRDETTTIPVRGHTLLLAGLDDPMELRTEPVKRALSKALRSLGTLPRSDFRLLLSHRPEAFLTDEMRDFDLVLSGHTHGGQWGFLGTSILDFVTGRNVHWGNYGKTMSRGNQEKRVRLYTTSGFGDWFPFRVACPREIPLLVLRRG